MAVPESVLNQTKVIAATRPRRRPKFRIPAWQAMLVLAILIGAWYLEAAHYSHKGLSFLVPYPHKVWQLGFANGQSRSAISSALGHTVEVTLTGLAIAIVIGILWAIVMSQAKWVEQALYPYAVILQCVPVLALVPLIGTLEGYGFQARVIVTVMIALFPMVSNTLFGLQSVDRSHRDLFKLAGANRLTMLTKLQLPAALPSIFVGLRTSAGLAVVGAIVGDEFFQRGSPGLGVQISVDQERLLGPQMYAAIIVAGLLGVLVFVAFGLLGRVAVGKWHDFD